jgi:ferredoxin hydrogenase
MGNKTTRREFITKTTTLGAGLLIGGYCNICLGQERERLKRASLPVSPNNPSIMHHIERCRDCGRCRDFCRNTAVFEQFVPENKEYCVRCGQCTLYCPEVLTERYHYQDVAKAIADPDKIVIASTAPSIRVALGEMFGLDPGTNVERETVGALKQLGVDYVLDATFSADLTIMEEASELLHRLGSKNRKKVKMPMFTSCCPAWVQYAKLYYPYLLPNLSTVKSPQMMQGALVKTYFAQKQGINPEKIVHVSFMPCTAKKGEILLNGMNSAGVSYKKPAMRDVDFTLTNRELAYLLKDGKVNLLQAQAAPYDSLMGSGSGSGMIFGNTGGVMEAALRTAYKVLNGSNPPADFLELTPLRGFDSVKQATVDLGVAKLNVAVVNGIGKVKSFIEALQNNTQQFDFIEIMACPGGCIGGGGQPAPSTMEELANLKPLRMSALYQHDVNQAIRLSCDNPEIKTIYEEFLGEPLGKKSAELLNVSGDG